MKNLMILACTAALIDVAGAQAAAHKETERYEADCTVWQYRVNPQSEAVLIHGPTMRALTNSAFVTQQGTARDQSTTRNTTDGVLRSFVHALSQRARGQPLPPGILCLLRGTEGSFVADTVNVQNRTQIAAQVKLELDDFVKSIEKSQKAHAERIVSKMIQALETTPPDQLADALREASD